MKFFGVGTDIVNVNRISKSIKKVKFLNKVFDTVEIKKCKKLKNASNCYAKRFAAKEAFAKSIGTGFRNNLNFKDIEILNDNMGKPYYFKSKKIDKIIKKKFKINKYNLFLSISDEKDYSIAFTILQIK